jgi:hypothetical protein
MTKEPTYTTIPPTPVIDCPGPKRPVLATISAVLLFIFAASEGLLAIVHGNVITICKNAVGMRLDIQSSPPLPAGAGASIPSVTTLQHYLRVETLLLGFSIAFAVLFIMHGIGLLRMKAGIPSRVITALAARFLTVNALFFYGQWYLSRGLHTHMDIMPPSVFAAINLLFYTLTIILLTRPSVRAAFAPAPKPATIEGNHD